MAVGPDGTVYVVDNQTNAVTGYAPGATGNATPTISISGSNTGIANPVGIVVDSSGAIYVANRGAAGNPNQPPAAILVFAPGANGNVAPRQTITGDDTGLSYVFSLALDASGNLYAADYADRQILIFPKTANGDAVPTAVLNDNDYNPLSVYVDGFGKIYVCASYGDTFTINVYAPGSTGDATPLQAISGSNTGLAIPIQLAVDGMGNMYVANSNPNDVVVFPAGANGNVAPTQTIGGSNTTISGPYGLTLGPVDATTFARRRH